MKKASASRPEVGLQWDKPGVLVTLLHPQQIPAGRAVVLEAFTASEPAAGTGRVEASGCTAVSLPRAVVCRRARGAETWPAVSLHALFQKRGEGLP